MKVYHIVGSMMVILAILFLCAPMMRRKEVEKTNLERKYFDLLNKYKSDKSETVLNELISVGKERFKTSEDEMIKEQIELDLKNFGAI